jgi:hypothetical protein
VARSILGAPGTRIESVPAMQRPSPQTSALSGVRLQQRLRERRSSRYLQAIKNLDAGAHHADAEAVKALLEAISAEFPELGIDQLPLGIVSRCYLGAPYVVHVCDLAGNIVEHYESWRSMPPPFERGRALALHGAYDFIEIYPDTMRAVDANGSVSVVEG